MSCLVSWVRFKKGFGVGFVSPHQFVLWWTHTADSATIRQMSFDFKAKRGSGPFFLFFDPAVTRRDDAAGILSVVCTCRIYPSVVENRARQTVRAFVLRVRGSGNSE